MRAFGEIMACMSFLVSGCAAALAGASKRYMRVLADAAKSPVNNVDVHVDGSQQPVLITLPLEHFIDVKIVATVDDPKSPKTEVTTNTSIDYWRNYDFLPGYIYIINLSNSCQSIAVNNGITYGLDRGVSIFKRSDIFKLMISGQEVDLTVCSHFCIVDDGNSSRICLLTGAQ